MEAGGEPAVKKPKTAESEASGNGRPASPGSGVSPAVGIRTLGVPLSVGMVVDVSGVATYEVWRTHIRGRSQGKDNFCVNCFKDHGLGPPMVCCDTKGCEMWTHFACAGVPHNKEPEFYERLHWNCGYCRTRPKSTARGTIVSINPGSPGATPTNWPGIGVRLAMPKASLQNPVFVWCDDPSFPIMPFTSSQVHPITMHPTPAGK
jgi:hypothetical protein